MSINKRIVIGVLISLLFLGLLLYRIDLAKTWEALTGADYWLIAPAIAVYFLGVWLRSVRWHYLLRPLKMVPTGRLYPIVVIGYMANDLLPLRAGELVRAYILGEKEKLSRLAILGSIAVERLLDGLSLLLFAGLAAFLLPVDEPLKTVFQAMAALYLAGLAVFFALASSPGRVEAIAKIILRLTPSPVSAKALAAMSRALDGLKAMSHPGWFSGAALFSALSWITEGALFYLIGVAFGIEQPVWVYLLAMAAANLATTIPSSQAGIGPFEYFCAQTLIIFGTDPAVATAYTVVVHAALIVPVVLGGFVHLWLEGLSWGQIASPPRAPALPSVHNLIEPGEEERQPLAQP